MEETNTPNPHPRSPRAPFPAAAVALATLAAAASTSTALADPTTTIVTHGFSQSKGIWVQSMAEAVIDRAGEGSIYRLNVSTGELDLVFSTGDPAAHIAIIFNWAAESDLNAWGFSEAAADALHAALRDPRFRASDGPAPVADLLTNRRVHLLGHSRGACVMSEVVERLALDAIPVDQLTTLDPHPVNGTLDACILPSSTDWGDSVPRKWNNITFADNYWRADGGGFPNSCDFDGISLTNYHNVQLSESALSSGGYSFSHLDVHLWYHGTIDTSQNPSDGEQTISNAMRTNWYPQGWTMVGWFFSHLGGGEAMRPANGPGEAPGPVPSIYGGSFDQASTAGWQFQGGGGDGAIVNGGAGNGFLRLGGAPGNPGPFGASRTHNRFFLPANSAAVIFEMRTTSADSATPDDALVVSLNSPAGSIPLGSILLDTVTGWTLASVPIPLETPRARTYTLVFTHSRGAASESVVEIDNVALEFAQPCTGDINGDGLINSTDLSQLLGAWGPVTTPPSTADLNNDNTVNATDLGLLLGAWGLCPV